MNNNFKLSKDKREKMIEGIQKYYEKEKGESIGNMEAMLILDFFIEKLAPYFYNEGIEDAYTYMTIKMEDIFEIQKIVN